MNIYKNIIITNIIKYISIIIDFKYSFKYLNMYHLCLKVPNYVSLNLFNYKICIMPKSVIYYFFLSILKYNILSFYFCFNIKLKLLGFRYKIYNFFNYILFYKTNSNFTLIKINKNIHIGISDNTLHLKSKNLSMLNFIANKIKNIFPEKKYSKEFFTYKKYNDIK